MSSRSDALRLMLRQRKHCPRSTWSLEQLMLRLLTCLIRPSNSRGYSGVPRVPATIDAYLHLRASAKTLGSSSSNACCTCSVMLRKLARTWVHASDSSASGSVMPAGKCHHHLTWVPEPDDWQDAPHAQHRSKPPRDMLMQGSNRSLTWCKSYQTVNLPVMKTCSSQASRSRMLPGSILFKCTVRSSLSPCRCSVRNDSALYCHAARDGA